MSEFSPARTVVICLLVTAIAACWWWLNQDAPSQQTSLVTADELPDYYVRAARVHQMDEQGQLQYILTADEALHYADEPRIELQGISANYHQAQGPIWRLNAQHGTIPEAQDVITLQGDVRMQHGQNQDKDYLVLDTNSLVVYPKRHTAETKDQVTLHNQAGTVTALGMLTNLRAGTTKLHRDVRGQYAQ